MGLKVALSETPNSSIVGLSVVQSQEWCIVGQYLELGVGMGWDDLSSIPLAEVGRGHCPELRTIFPNSATNGD